MPNFLKKDNQCNHLMKKQKKNIISTRLSLSSNMNKINYNKFKQYSYLNKMMDYLLKMNYGVKIWWLWMISCRQFIWIVSIYRKSKISFKMNTVLKRLLMSCRCSSTKELHILLWIGLKEELEVYSSQEIGARGLI